MERIVYCKFSLRIWSKRFLNLTEQKWPIQYYFHWTLAGYLIAFLTIFLEAASPRSMPHISANLMRYSSTSESSSPKCSLSDSSQLGKPLSTSPLHWNISDSSPTSPTYTWWDKQWTRKEGKLKILSNHWFT